MRVGIPRLALLGCTVLVLAACTSDEAELYDRCQRADQVVATYESRIGPPIDLDNAWMVESNDRMLEAWYFISAMVRGGGFDGEIATWQLPAFSGSVDPVNTPNLSVPANSVAAGLDIGSNLSLEPADYGLRDWSEIEGFDESQRCAQRTRS